MSKPVRTVFLAALVMVTGGLWVDMLDNGEIPSAVSARGVREMHRAGKERGEFGADLGFLRRFHVGPQSAFESNHYFDLWSPGALTALARYNGLTNNRALIVDSHGSAGFRWHGRGYGLYPHETLLAHRADAPCFSPADFAQVLGRDDALAIHNIIIAGCNEEGRFRSREWRRHFLNATNITHMMPGRLAYKPMFYQAMVTPSSEIKPLFGREQRAAARIESIIEREPSPGAEPLGVYIADLYLPGARKPYRIQRAGRELLEPTRPSTRSLLAGLGHEGTRP
jgi:hypothetical protein